MRGFPLLNAFVLLLLCSVVSGCATTRPLYHWGNYEAVLNTSYTNPGQLDTGAEIEILTEDIERARAEHSRVPPGVHAHLGYLYSMQGNMGAAKNHFVLEKKLFPESAVFIDGILKRLAKKSR